MNYLAGNFVHLDQNRKHGEERNKKFHAGPAQTPDGHTGIGAYQRRILGRTRRSHARNIPLSVPHRCLYDRNLHGRRGGHLDQSEPLQTRREHPVRHRAQQHHPAARAAAPLLLHHRTVAGLHAAHPHRPQEDDAPAAAHRGTAGAQNYRRAEPDARTIHRLDRGGAP